jgi:hypothetical protein
MLVHRLLDFIINIEIIFILLFTIFFGFHSTRGWKLLIRWFYNKLWMDSNKLIFSIFVCNFPIILYTCNSFYFYMLKVFIVSAE